MARPLRREVENGWYHVFGRGLERRAIFRDAGDRRHLLELLETLHDRYRVYIHAYALMDNHYHALLQTPDANLSQGMQWLHGSYSAWYNAKHRRVGPLFQGRYRAIPVENGAWAYALSVYVHLNPLRVAGLGLDKQGRVEEGKGFREPTPAEAEDRVRRLREYRWSSYRAYAGYEQAPIWLRTEELLARAHGDEAQRQRHFRHDVQERLTRGVEVGRVEQLREAVAIGSASFVRRVRDVAADRPLRGISGKKGLRRRVTWQEVRAIVEKVKGEAWSDFAERYGDEGRDLFLWAVRRFCGLSLSQIGEIVGSEYAAVSAAARRLEKRSAADARLRELQTRITEMLNVAP